jgi:hypothetical protein
MSLRSESVIGDRSRRIGAVGGVSRIRERVELFQQRLVVRGEPATGVDEIGTGGDRAV